MEDLLGAGGAAPAAATATANASDETRTAGVDSASEQRPAAKKASSSEMEAIQALSAAEAALKAVQVRFLFSPDQIVSSFFLQLFFFSNMYSILWRNLKKKNILLHTHFPHQSKHHTY